MQIDETQFGDALLAALLFDSIDDLREAARSGISRSYFVESESRLLPLKAVLRLAYRREGIPWDSPQSSKAARLLGSAFNILHITEEIESERLERQRKSANRWERDAKFRAKVLDLYSSTCVISGCTVLDAIDAAHLLAVGEAGEDRAENGITLRADLHRLFDAKPHQMSIDPVDLTVHFAKSCASHYSEYEGVVIAIPLGGPKARSFTSHWKAFRSSQFLET